MSSSRPLLFRNAVIHTVDDRRPRADWFVALGERIQRLGVGPPPERFLGRTVDLGGRTVVPGFVDAHTHFFQTGVDMLHVNLAGATSLEELGERLLRQAPDGSRSWIFANGFEEDALCDVDRLTRTELDAVSTARPIWVNRVDYHSAVVNTLALKRLEVPPGTPGLVAGANGDPVGILRADAYFHAKARVARLYTIETKERAIRAAVAQLLPKGITAVHALEGGRVFGDEGVHQVLKRMDSLPVDLTLFLQEKNVYITKRLGFEHLGGCILIDGSIGSYTAALDADYLGYKGVRGVLYEKPRELANFVDEAHRAGIQLAFHAIGPRAIELILTTYERALDKTPRFDHRHRIEHFELATDEQIRRASDLGLVVSMQPAFEYFWGGPDGMYASRIGDRWRMTNRLRTILDAGLRIAGGSDTNVTPPDPMLGIHAAVNHPNPEQRITVAEALRMMTLDAAFAGFNDERHGSLTPGKDASFAVLEHDLFGVAPGELKDVRVLETWHCGRRTWRDKTVER